jgi:large conductance mechanosensitive channel
MLKEFQEFAVKGNVVDLAVGVIIGAAFGAIVGSIVDDLFMPIVGAVLGGLDFSNHFIPLSENVTATNLAEARKQGAVLAYGAFLTKFVNFMIIAWILFMVVKGINQLRRQFEKDKAPPPPPETPADVKLLTEIRDLIAAEAKPAAAKK